MKREISLRYSALVAALLLVAPGSARAHLGDIVYPIYEVPTADLPDLHDGTLEDWEDALPNASLTHNEFQFDSGTSGRIDPGNLAIRVFLAWHHASQRLCVAVERLDDVYLPPSVCCDGLTLFEVDGDHSGGQYGFFGDEYSEEESRRRSYAQAQSYSAYPENTFDGRLLLVLEHLAWTTSPPWADYGGWQFGESPNLSAVEFCVTPWDDLVYNDSVRSRRSALEPGRVIGFQLSAHDGDVANRASATYTLAVATVHANVTAGDFAYSHSAFADNFVDGELVPCDQADCSGATTSVKPDTWARIKAAFR